MSRQGRSDTLSPVKIPKSELGELLDSAALNKTKMVRLMKEMEEAATGQKIAKPGGWRHQPLKWLEKHLKRVAFSKASKRH